MIPNFCLADMVGFSGDKRRYVTDEEKSQFPYNTVVRIEKNGGASHGTGTFVSKDVILTCRHVVDGNSSQTIDYFTADGMQYSGDIIAGTSQEEYDDQHDFAWVVNRNAFSGSVLKLSPKSISSNNLTIIGYDSLKPLSNDEIQIIKHVYSDWIKKNGKIKKDNAFDAMAAVDVAIKFDYACSFGQKEGCVKCKNPNSRKSCLFNDGENMKVRKGCRVTSVGSLTNQITTNCPGASGASGSAIIDENTNQIIGVLCNVVRPQIGQEQQATSSGTTPEVYYKSLKYWIDGMKNW